jgi:RimJ/RimL family protein N-acetyltransferase
LKEGQERISSATLVALRNFRGPLFRASALERLAQGLDVVDDSRGLGRRQGKDGLELTLRRHDGIDEIEVRVVFGAEVDPDASHVVRRGHGSREHREEVGGPAFQVVMRNRERLPGHTSGREKEKGEERLGETPQYRAQNNPPSAAGASALPDCRLVGWTIRSYRRGERISTRLPYNPRVFPVIETDRLILRRLEPDDAEFILGLLNDPSFLRFIGDKGVRTLDDAREYIRTGPMASYERLGFGLFLTALREDRAPIGICGLLKREALDDVDVGFAFLPRYWSKGYGFESAAAVLDYGRRVLGLTRIVAITSPDNASSIRLLEKLGLKFETMIRLSEDSPEVRLFASEAP